MTTRIAVAFLTLTVALGAQTNTSAQQNETYCPQKFDVRLNAATREVAGKSYFSRNSTVRVCVFNLNPFSTSYKLKIQSDTLEKVSIAQVLGQYGLLGVEDTKPSPTEKADDDNTTNAIKSYSAATSQTSFLDSFTLPPIDDLTASITKAQNLKTRMDTTKQEFAMHLKQLRAPAINEALSKLLAREVVALAATQPSNEVSKPPAPTPEELKTIEDQLRANIATIDANMLQIDEKISTRQSNAQAQQMQALNKNSSAPLLHEQATQATKAINALPQSVSTIIDSARALIAKLESMQDEYESFYSTLQATSTMYKRILADPDSFTIATTIHGDPTGGRKVTIGLEASNFDDTKEEYKQIASAEIQFGYQVIAVSTGIAGSTMKKPEYTAITTTAKDGAGQATTTNTIGLQSNSGRLLPMVQLNADLHDWSLHGHPLSLNASMGVTGKADSQGTNIEFLLGPSLGFLGNKLFITAGAYGGRQPVLQSGYSLGSTIPSTTVPTGKSLQWGFGWSLTWKIK